MLHMKKRYISYLRVSTVRQGVSGLGIEAQRASVSQFVDPTTAEIIQEFIETESGRRRQRPALEEALKACRIMSAVLVVAKVDRLTRSAAFLHQLLDSGVEIEFCDLPEIAGPTGKFLLNQMAAVSELEAAFISQRTKAALAAAKARGVKLGNPQNLKDQDRLKGNRVSAMARGLASGRRKEELLAVVSNLVVTQRMSLRKAASTLNARGIPAIRGGRWTATQVSRIVKHRKPKAGSIES